MAISIINSIAGVEPNTGAMFVDTLQHPYGWTYQRRGFLCIIPANTVSMSCYYRILNASGDPMSYRPISGGYISEDTQSGDKFNVDLCVKGEDIGGASPANDILLYSFIFEEYPVNNIRQPLFAADKSLLIPETANLLNPQLPAVPLYFRIKYTAINADNVNAADLHFWLEGFQPPAT